MKNKQPPASDNDKGCALAIGAALREERKKQKIGIELAAKALNITASYISQIEKGKKNPTLTILENYADFLGLGLFELSLRVKIIQSTDHKSIKQLISGLSGIIDSLAKLNDTRQ